MGPIGHELQPDCIRPTWVSEGFQVVLGGRRGAFGEREVSGVFGVSGTIGGCTRPMAVTAMRASLLLLFANRSRSPQMRGRTGEPESHLDLPACSNDHSGRGSGIRARCVVRGGIDTPDARTGVRLHLAPADVRVVHQAARVDALSHRAKPGPGVAEVRRPIARSPALHEA